MIPSRQLLLSLPFLLFAGGCDQIAVLDGTKAREADAIAVGSACRLSGRALEDCFAMYPDSGKAQVFAGWKEMNDYMTANKIEVVVPTLVKAEIKSEPRADKQEVDHDGKPAASGKVNGRPLALPPTSAAAADPLAGLPKATVGAASEKPSAKAQGDAPAARH